MSQLKSKKFVKQKSNESPKMSCLKFEIRGTDCGFPVRFWFLGTLHHRIGTLCGCRWSCYIYLKKESPGAPRHTAPPPSAIRLFLCHAALRSLPVSLSWVPLSVSVSLFLFLSLSVLLLFLFSFSLLPYITPSSSHTCRSAQDRHFHHIKAAASRLLISPFVADQSHHTPFTPPAEGGGGGLLLLLLLLKPWAKLEAASGFSAAKRAAPVAASRTASGLART